MHLTPINRSRRCNGTWPAGGLELRKLDAYRLYIFVLSMQSYILYVDARLLYVHYSVECQSNHTRMQLITAYMPFNQSMLTFDAINLLDCVHVVINNIVCVGEAGRSDR